MDTLTNNFLDNDAVDLNLDGIKTDNGLITYTDDFAIPVENRNILLAFNHCSKNMAG